jgi:HD-GYP domain-containing protein (c-di-GMP phosphodiesterase class II)
MVRFSEILRQGKKERNSSLRLSRDEEMDTLGMTLASLPSIVDSRSEKVKTCFLALLNKADGVRESVIQDRAIDRTPILHILEGILEEKLVEDLYGYAVSSSTCDGLPTHTVCVTLGSLKVGQGMGYGSERLRELGLAAFLENVGMYQIPDHILPKEGELTPQEIAAIKEHPEMSAKLLGEMGLTFRWLAAVAVQTHERADGSGYPRGVKGEKIAEFASIIGLVDTYMAMIEARPYRKKHSPAEAVKFVVTSCKNKFSAKVVKAFLNEISLFPINTQVRLNDHKIGRVVQTHRRHPLNPKVELIYDAVGQSLGNEEIVDLAQCPTLHIVEAIEES